MEIDRENSICKYCKIYDTDACKYIDKASIIKDSCDDIQRYTYEEFAIMELEKIKAEFEDLILLNQTVALRITDKYIKRNEYKEIHLCRTSVTDKGQCSLMLDGKTLFVSVYRNTDNLYSLYTSKNSCYNVFDSIQHIKQGTLSEIQKYLDYKEYKVIIKEIQILHEKDLLAFKNWLIHKGWTLEEVREESEVLRAEIEGKRTLSIYKRLDEFNTEYLSVSLDEHIDIIQDFLNDYEKLTQYEKLFKI